MVLESIRPDRSSDWSKGVLVISGARPPYEQQIRSTSRTLDGSNGSGDEYDSDDSEDTTELQMRSSSIHDILANLNKLSFKIRNPALRTQHTKATTYREMVSTNTEEKYDTPPKTINGDANLDLAQWLDQIHVSEKPDGDSFMVLETSPLLYDLPAEKPLLGAVDDFMDVFDQYAVHDEQHMGELFRTSTSSEHAERNPILIRLTHAITNRRRAGRYWTLHAEKLSSGISVPNMRSAVIHREENEIPRDTTERRTTPSFVRGPTSVAAPSTAYPETEVSNNYDKRLDSVSDSQSVVSYASTTWDDQGRGLVFPPEPRTATSGLDFVRSTIHRLFGREVLN